MLIVDTTQTFSRLPLYLSMVVISRKRRSLASNRHSDRVSATALIHIHKENLTRPVYVYDSSPDSTSPII